MQNVCMHKAIVYLLGVAALSAGLADCSGGSPAAIPAPVVAVATVAPSTTPTVGPSASPTASASPAPTPTHSTTPTASPSPVAAATPLAPLKVLRAAPLSANPVGLSFLRRPQAGGVTSSLPILVESSGTSALWAGNFIVWVTDANTGLDVAEQTGTITATNGVPVSNPAFSSIACPATSSTWCAVHPLGWQFGTSSTNNKPVGKQTLTVTFGDGLSGQIPDYIYDGWSIPCNTGIVYAGAHVNTTTTQATSDVYADCAHTNMVFPKGAILYSNPVSDSYGRTETILPTITNAIFLSSAVINVPMVSFAAGQVYGINTQDGGMAKVYFTSQPGLGTLSSASGMSLYANPNGTYAF